MSMRQANGDVVMSGAKGSGTYTAPLYGNAGLADVIIATHVTAVTGTSPTLIVSVEQSADGSSYSAVTGSATATLNATGNVLTNAAITQPYARITAVVGGTTPNFTFRVAVLVFAD